MRLLSRHTDVIFGAGLGLLYGIALAILAALSAAAGDGPYVLVGLSSAPAGLFGPVAALLGAPLVWSVAGAISRLTRGRKWFVALLVAHYVSGIWLLRGDYFGDWELLLHVVRVAPLLVFMWTMIYLGGQYAAWLAVIRGSDSVTETPFDTSK
jgi:hypothetical protein